MFISAESEAIGAQADTTIDIYANELVDGFAIIFHVVSPSDGQTIVIDPATGYVRLEASLDGIEVGAATVVVDNETLDESFGEDFDQDIREEIMDRVQSGSYELTLIHDLELDGMLDVSIAGSEADLFSDDPLREVRLDRLVLTPDLEQTGEFTTAELELIATFAQVHVGFRGVVSGTSSGYGGRTNLSRFAAGQRLRTELKITARVRVGS